MNPRKRFRQLLAQPGLIVQPAVYDPLGARIAEESGIQAIGLGGYVLGAHMAVSEPLLSLEDMARVTRQISYVSNLPIMVDAGAGWGEPIHVMHTVAILEQAGAASIHLEDQYYPKRVSYHRGSEEIISVDEMVVKIRAAVKARRDPDFMIVARCDAMRTHGYDEAIQRSHEYLKAGAEGILVFPNNEEETKRVPKDIPGVPLVYVTSTGNRFGRGVYTAGQLADWGWKIMFDAISCVNATADAMYRYFRTLSETGDSGLNPDYITNVRLNLETTIGLGKLYEIEDSTVR